MFLGRPEKSKAAPKKRRRKVPLLREPRGPRHTHARAGAERKPTPTRAAKNVPERDDVPALVAALDHDGPAIEQSDITRARQVGIQCWLSWRNDSSVYYRKWGGAGRRGREGREKERKIDTGLPDLHTVARYRTNCAPNLREDDESGQPKER